jgi:hypothetical protein
MARAALTQKPPPHRDHCDRHHLGGGVGIAQGLEARQVLARPARDEVLDADLAGGRTLPYTKALPFSLDR